MASPFMRQWKSCPERRAWRSAPVYATLDRLEDKGLVSSWLSDPTPERGGRSKRYYKLEVDGERALRESALMARRICDALENEWGSGLWTGKWKPARRSNRADRATSRPARGARRVMGDLSERYVSPGQYLTDALRTIPFVVASRIRRTQHPVGVAFMAVFLMPALVAGFPFSCVLLFFMRLQSPGGEALSPAAARSICRQ